MGDASILRVSKRATPQRFAAFLLAIALGLFWSAPSAHAQDFFVVNSNNATVGEYTTSGVTVNAALLSGLGNPYGLTGSGSNIFVVNGSNVGEYTTSGVTVNASLITGVSNDTGLAISGSNLFAVNGGSTVGKYTTSGATVNAAFISGLSTPWGIAVAGSNIYVTNSRSNTIGVYNATTGARVNASLISGLSRPLGIAVSGSNIYVTNFNAGTVGVYTTSGARVNAALISGLTNPLGIAVSGSNIFVTNWGSGKISEYTTSGTLVNASLVTGLSGPAQLFIPTATVATVNSVVVPTADSGVAQLGMVALNDGQAANDALLGYLAGGPVGDFTNSNFASNATPAAASPAPLQLAFNGGMEQLSQLVTRLPETMARLGGWFRGLGEFANFNGGTSPGFTSQSGGFLAGIDRPFGEHMSLGGAFGYSRTNLNVHDGENGTLDSPRLMAYAHDDFGRWALDGSVGYGFDSINLNRTIASAGQTATSAHDGQEATASAQATTHLALGDLTLTPAAGFAYVHLYETGYTESGAPGNNLTVSSRNSDSLRPFIGATISRIFTADNGVRYMPEASLTYSHELFNTPPSLVQVGGGSFTVSSLASSRDELTVGAGITARATGRLLVTADYHAVLPTGNLIAQTVSVGLRYNF